MSAHADVHDVAVLGVPDDETGERVKAFVQLRAGIEPTEARATELIGHCRRELAHYTCPKELACVEELPPWTPASS